MQQPPNKGIPTCFGVGLLVTGVLTVLAICGLSGILFFSVHTVFQEQEVLLLGGVLVFAAFIVLVVPGGILLFLSKRR